MTHISDKEFLEHIEDDDFFDIYGDPVAIESDNDPTIVVLSIEHYNHLLQDRQNYQAKLHDNPI